MPLIHSVGSEANADIDVDEINNLAFLVNEQVEDVRDKVKRFQNKIPSLFAKGTGENSLALRTKLASYCPLREAQITSTAAVPARKSGRVRIKVFSLRALVLPIHLSLQASNRKAASSSAATASKILLIYPDAEVSVYSFSTCLLFHGLSPSLCRRKTQSQSRKTISTLSTQVLSSTTQ